MKFEPQSHLILAVGPRMDRKRRSAQMNALVSIDSRTSMCMARLFEREKTSPQRLEFATPPLSFCLYLPWSEDITSDVSERTWGFGPVGGKVRHVLDEYCSPKPPTYDAGTDDFRQLPMATSDPEAGCAHCSVSYMSTLMMCFLMLVPND